MSWQEPGTIEGWVAPLTLFRQAGRRLKPTLQAEACAANFHNLAFGRMVPARRLTTGALRFACKPPKRVTNPLQVANLSPWTYLRSTKGHENLAATQLSCTLFDADARRRVAGRWIGRGEVFDRAPQANNTRIEGGVPASARARHPRCVSRKTLPIRERGPGHLLRTRSGGRVRRAFGPGGRGRRG